MVARDTPVGNRVRKSVQASYPFRNAFDDARLRLQLFEEAYDQQTIRRLEALGVAAGWSCLEIGAGAGSVSRWLSNRVGRHGRVVAVDLDTRFLEELDADNVDVHRLDLATAPLPSGDFDLVHSRAVLIFVAGRDRVVARLVSALRPGGWLLLEEGDDYPLESGSPPAFVEGWRCLFDALAAAGTGPDLRWARHLPTLLDRYGLQRIAGEADVKLFRGQSSLAEFMEITLGQGLQQALLTPTDREHVEGALSQLGDPEQWFAMPAMVAVWGQQRRDPEPGED